MYYTAAKVWRLIVQTFKIWCNICDTLVRKGRQKHSQRKCYRYTALTFLFFRTNEHSESCTLKILDRTQNGCTLRLLQCSFSSVQYLLYHARTRMFNTNVQEKRNILQVHFGDAIDFNTLNECVQFIPNKWHNSWT